MKISGTISKLISQVSHPIQYELPLGEAKFAIGQCIGKNLKLSFTGNIFCQHCGKKTKKSYGQGYCYPCTLKLAECDLCILRPETCHYAKGTCREPQWGEEHCMRPHIVYLANSSGIKVGITRKTQVPTRWIDQGASEALAVMEVKSRLDSGLVEVLFKKHISDKTDWRKMLKGEPERIDLEKVRDELLHELSEDLKKLDITLLKESVQRFIYPVEVYPEKVSSLSFDKTPVIEGKLLGIKGQYLIFDKGVLNVRAHTSYEITVEENATT